MIKFIKAFFGKRESKFEHPLDAVTTSNVPVPADTPPIVETVVETPVAEPTQKKKRNYNKKTK